jgi:8-oxo-dGTP diphosphatase
VVTRLRRIAAYGLCRDRADRVLLVQSVTGLTNSGRWFLPGGGVEHGEHPEDTVAREVAEETGLTVAVGRIRAVITDLEELSDGIRHHDRLIFDVTLAPGGELHTREGARWVPMEELASLDLMPFVTQVLGLAEPTRTTRLPDVRRPADVPTQFQRFAAYGLVTDPDGRVLLTLIAAGYPGTGLWHLPGGGTDFGEGAEEGFLRELVEETAQVGRVTELVGVSHRHTPQALGPEGTPIDWHGVRVIFRTEVDHPTVARVIEDHGGSTERAAWFEADEALRLPLTEVAREAVTAYHPQ